MMQIVFISTSILGLLYFLLAKRQFDFFTIGFFSACVYFLPGYLGYTFYPSDSGGGRVPVDLLDETYMVMISLLVTILVGAFFFDFSKKKQVINLSLKNSKYFVHAALGLATLGCLMTVFSSGYQLLSTNKLEMMETLSRWYTLWAMTASLGAVVAFNQKRYGFLFIFISLLLATVFIGFRSPFAMVFISLVVIIFSTKGKVRFILKNMTLTLFSVVGVLFLFLYKSIYLAVKSGDFDIIVDKISDTDVAVGSFLHSEPFTTQVILNEVIKTDFRVSGEHFIGLLNNLILFSSNLGFKSESFNSHFQPALFPYFDYGMANNIWAEMWSAGGWLLLVFFMFLYVCVLFIGSYLLRISDPVIKGGVALFFSYWAFYIHRNDISYQITLEKRVFLLWFVCLLLSFFLILLVRGINTKKLDASRLSRDDL